MIADWNEMKRRKATRRLTAFLVASTLMTALATVAHADPVASKPFHIPAQSLPSALALFGRQAGLQVSIPAALVEGKISHAVDGTMAPAQSLAQILSSTGLTYRINGSVVTLSKASAAITLGPVRVGGTYNAHQNPTGPGVGYVAENTMAGTKTDTPITEVPNSIYVVTKQQMVDQQPQSTQDALKYTAGVYAGALGTDGNGSSLVRYSIYQRGFASQQFVDGLRSQALSGGEPNFVERIEAVNGPASVMFGQVPAGGMIAIRLK